MMTRRAPARCASCNATLQQLKLHKTIIDGIVTRERICERCYKVELYRAIDAEDFQWAKLNQEVTTLKDTINAIKPRSVKQHGGQNGRHRNSLRSSRTWRHQENSRSRTPRP